MVQATNTGSPNNGTELRRFNSSGFRWILVQRQVGSAGMIVVYIFSENPLQMPLVHDDDMIQTFPAYGPDNTFTVMDFAMASAVPKQLPQCPDT